VDSHPPITGKGISTGKPKADVRRKSAEKAKRVFLTMADMMAGGMLIYLPHYLVQFFVKKIKNLNVKNDLILDSDTLFFVFLWEFSCSLDKGVYLLFHNYLVMLNDLEEKSFLDL